MTSAPAAGATERPLPRSLVDNAVPIRGVNHALGTPLGSGMVVGEASD